MTTSASATPFAVNQWCSHPDAGNDDCQTGEDFETLELATDAYDKLVAEYFIAFIELTGPDGLRRVRANSAFNAKRVARERAADDDEWRHEQAMEAGMLHGVEGYNEAMGYEVEAYDPDIHG